jgi:hypothetical protein
MVKYTLYLSAWQINMYIYSSPMAENYPNSLQKTLQDWILRYPYDPQCKDTNKSANIEKVGQTLLVSDYYHVIPIAFMKIYSEFSMIYDLTAFKKIQTVRK